MKTKKTDPEENWNEKWKGILQRSDGSIDIEQLKLELVDFEDMMDRIISLTSYMTQGRLSYATYGVDTIVQVHEECLEDERDYQKKDDRVDGVCSFCDREFDEV